MGKKEKKKKTVASPAREKIKKIMYMNFFQNLLVLIQYLSTYLQQCKAVLFEFACVCLMKKVPAKIFEKGTVK